MPVGPSPRLRFSPNPVEGEEYEEISQNTEKNSRQLKQKIYPSQIVPMLVVWGSF